MKKAFYAIKSGGTVFCLYHLGQIVYQGAVCVAQVLLDKSHEIRDHPFRTLANFYDF